MIPLNAKFTNIVTLVMFNTSSYTITVIFSINTNDFTHTLSMILKIKYQEYANEQGYMLYVLTLIIL